MQINKNRMKSIARSVFKLLESLAEIHSTMCRKIFHWNLMQASRCYTYMNKEYIEQSVHSQLIILQMPMMLLIRLAFFRMRNINRGAGGNLF